ncbi:MAG TPA: LUD domain-containing protein [Chitinophagaceae bacterium]
MGSREKILSAIRQSKPEAVELETGPYTPERTGDLVGSFAATLESIGGRCTVLDDRIALEAFLAEEGQKGARMVNGIKATPGYNLEAVRSSEARELESVQVAILQGELGVAENGAIWVTEEALGHRILPFITQGLVLVLAQSRIVATMHDAYEQLAVDEPGYGVFIAGPSKTADIEQSLVIGAHGPVAMQVLILKDQ